MKGTWPQLQRTGPELPMNERVRRYQANISAIRASGSAVPTVAMPDTLDPIVIEKWFREGEARSARMRGLIAALSTLPDETMVPSL